ncbi:hypothetical protein PanWU01x14_041370, partial [Parasponia andersonii]
MPPLDVTTLTLTASSSNSPNPLNTQFPIMARYQRTDFIDHIWDFLFFGREINGCYLLLGKYGMEFLEGFIDRLPCWADTRILFFPIQNPMYDVFNSEVAPLFLMIMVDWWLLAGL